jgi:hypothetical protein
MDSSPGIGAAGEPNTNCWWGGTGLGLLKTRLAEGDWAGVPKLANGALALGANWKGLAVKGGVKGLAVVTEAEQQAAAGGSSSGKLRPNTCGRGRVQAQRGRQEGIPAHLRSSQQERTCRSNSRSCSWATGCSFTHGLRCCRYRKLCASGHWLDFIRYAITTDGERLTPDMQCTITCAIPPPSSRAQERRCTINHRDGE